MRTLAAVLVLLVGLVGRSAESSHAQAPPGEATARQPLATSSRAERIDADASAQPMGPIDRGLFVSGGIAIGVPVSGIRWIQENPGPVVQLHVGYRFERYFSIIAGGHYAAFGSGRVADYSSSWANGDVGVGGRLFAPIAASLDVWLSATCGFGWHQSFGPAGESDMLIWHHVLMRYEVGVELRVPGYRGLAVGLAVAHAAPFAPRTSPATFGFDGMLDATHGGPPDLLSVAIHMTAYTHGL